MGGVQGYPTIKWGDPNDLKDYEGGREFKDLKKFAEENLGPTCGPENLDLCDEDQKKQIAKFQKMDLDELDIKIEEAEAKVKTMEEAGKKIETRLQGQISDLSKK